MREIKSNAGFSRRGPGPGRLGNHILHRPLAGKYKSANILEENNGWDPLELS